MKKIFAAIFFLMVGFTSSDANIRLCFVGDIMIHKQQLESAERLENNKVVSYDFRPHFRQILPLLSSDILIGNFETTLPGKNYSGYPMFGAPDSLADALSEAGFDVLLLANNHIYDKGISGLVRTIDTLEEKGFITTGAWKIPESSPLKIEVNGIKLGIINYSYGSNVPITEKISSLSHLNIINEDSIRKDIEFLKNSGAQFIIATFHWGNEYQPKPSPHQRKIAEVCFDAGADAVIGTHPHILQPIKFFERDGRNLVAAYSLGNFVSFQRTLPRERSVILALEISVNDGKPILEKVEVTPTWVEVLGRGKKRLVQIIKAKPKIEKEILSFLGIRGEKGADGFFEIEKKSEAQ